VPYSCTSLTMSIWTRFWDYIDDDFLVCQAEQCLFQVSKNDYNAHILTFLPKIASAVLTLLFLAFDPIVVVNCCACLSL
jgi:hypothetical protein